MTSGRMIASRLALALAVAVAVAGCLDGAPSLVAPSPTREPEPTPITTTYDLGASVWYEGLVLHIDRVTSTLDARGGPVEVALRVDNPGVETAELQGTIFLRVDGLPIEPTRESRIPPIPAEGQVASLMTYELQGVTSVDDATVQVGGAPSHVAFAPLTTGGGTTVTLEPQVLLLTGTGTAGDLRITLTGGLQRWDLPDWWEELAADRQAIIVDYDATFLGDFPGGFAFTGENVALRLPDGTDVPPRADGHSQSVELIGAGKTKRGLFSRFEIPAGVAGEVSLVVTDLEEEQLIPLVIPG
jgi:hypothetical protein